MADGTVTIKALFDGKDAESGAKRIKSSLEGLKGSAGKVGSVFKSVLGANLIGGAIMTGISALGNGMKSMVGELNSSAKHGKRLKVTCNRSTCLPLKFSKSKASCRTLLPRPSIQRPTWPLLTHS